MIDLNQHPDVQASLAQCKAALANYEEHVANLEQKTNQVSQQQQSADAAEADAQAFKEQARQRLRELAGKPDKKLHDLRASERASYSLAEDYRSFMAELELARDEAELEVDRAASKYLSTRHAVLNEYAHILMQQAMANLEPLLAALKLQERSHLAEGQFAEWRQRRFNSALDAVMTDFKAELSRRVSAYSLQEDPIVACMPIDDAIRRHANNTSPMKLKSRQQALEARKQELNA